MRCETVAHGRRGGGTKRVEEKPSHACHESGAPARVVFALSLFERARGLLGRGPSWLGEGGLLVFVPCKSIHTFGMRKPIDVAFADGRGRVLRAVHGMPPCRVAGCRGARIVIERFSSPARGSWFEVGDELGITVLEMRGDTQKEMGALPCT